MIGILTLALAAIFGGYLLAEASVFDPVLEPLRQWADGSDEGFRGWLSGGLVCHVCTGTWVTLLLAVLSWTPHGFFGGYKFDLVAIMAANGLHLAWLTIEGALTQA